MKISAHRHQLSDALHARGLRRPAAVRDFERHFACHRQPGFTLLELLVVIVIIGLLAGLVVPRYFDTVSKSKAKIVRAQMDSFEKALEQYRLDVGSLPAVEQGLHALITPPAGVTQWQGPYLKKAVPLDPWGNAYIYKLSPNRREPDIVSLGADGQPGGAGEDKDIALSGTD
jgi:general secretion pathway protein G